MERELRVLRPELLAGLDVVLSGTGVATAHAEERGQSCIASVLRDLGADVRHLEMDPLDDDAVTAAAQALDRATVLVCDAGAAMRAASAAGAASEPGAAETASNPTDGLRAAVEGAWTATRAVVNAHLAPAGFGKVVLVAPRPCDGPDAAAAGAAFENLARTTGVEWARLGIRVVAVRPRDITSDEALAQCVAYLASPAGDYFSGCVLDLGAAGLSSSPPAA